MPERRCEMAVMNGKSLPARSFLVNSLKTFKESKNNSRALCLNKFFEALDWYQKAEEVEKYLLQKGCGKHPKEVPFFARNLMRFAV